MTDRLWNDDDVDRCNYALGVPLTTEARAEVILDAVLPAIRKRWLTELADEWVNVVVADEETPLPRVDTWLRRKTEEVSE